MFKKILSELSEPILIGGKVLEQYKIRKSVDWDFLIKESDFKKLSKKYNPKILNDGIKVITIQLGDSSANHIDLYLTSCGKKYTYEKLYKNSCKWKDMRILSLIQLISFYSDLKDHFNKMSKKHSEYKKLYNKAKKDEIRVDNFYHKTMNKLLN
jgi:hypothetical protein